MADDGKVVIELVGKDSATQTFVKSFQDMSNSIKKLETSGDGLGKLGSAFNMIKGHWAALSGVIGGGLSFAKFWSDFDKLAASESALLKMAKRLNDTVENVSALGYVAKKSGMDADAFNIALERMQKNVSNAAKGVSEASDLVDEFGEPVGKASKTLDELGLRAEVLNKLPLPQKLKEISSAMKDNVAPADQARIALELFGKSGGGLVIALKEGPEAIQKWIDRYTELGGVLTTEGAEAMSKAKTAAGDLSIAWNNFSRELYENVGPSIAFIIGRLTDLVLFAKTVPGQLSKVMARVPLAPGSGAATMYGDAEGSGGGGGGGGWGSLPGDSFMSPVDLRKTPTTAPPKKAGGGGGGGKGGGGSAESAEKSVRSFIETMLQATAQGAGDTEAILQVWKGKQLQTLEELAAKGGDIAQAKIALGQAVDAKQRKIDSDFTDWYNTSLGNQYETLVAEQRKKLTSVEGNEAKTAQVKEVYARKFADLSREMETERTNLFKGYLDTMAGLSPVLADQLGYKREGLALELKLADAALDRSRREGKITQDTYDQARAMQAVAAQAKKFSLEMENDKGLQGWAYGRVKEADQRKPIQNMMGSAESFMGETFGTQLVASITGKKEELKNLFKDIFSQAMAWVYKTNAQSLMDYGAKLISPKQGSSAVDRLELKNLNLEARSFRGFDREVRDFSKATDQFGKFSQTGLTTYDKYASQINTAFPQLSQASLGLQSTVSPVTGAAGEMTASSTAGTMSSVAMIGAAGGMALSAIGMLTSSKELSMAGMVISTAAAILQTAAMIIMASESIPFFHSGGPIYAHTGWPRLHSDEVPIIAQTGERVLSRRQNRDYEAGMAAGGGGGGVVYSPTYHINAIDARGVEAVLERHGKTMAKVINREVGRRGRRL